VYTVRAGGGQYTESQAEGIEVMTSGVVGHVDLSVQSAGSITGKITAVAGPVEGADVTVFGADGQAFTAETDSSGNYTVPSLPAQTYTVTAFAGGLFAGTPLNVSLAPGQARTGVDLSLASAGSISGKTISRADGSPVPAVLLEAKTGSSSFAAQSDSNGDFLISDLPPGNYVINAFSTELMTTSVAMAVTAGATQNVNIQVAPLGSVSGTVRRAGGGMPLANLTVTARDASGTQASDLTDELGEYELDGLDGGTYSIIVGAAGAPGAAETQVTLTGAATTATADFSIPIVATVSGKVLASDGISPVAFATVELTQNASAIATAISDEAGNYQFLTLVAGSFQLEASATDLAFSPVPINLANGANVTNQNLTAGTVAITGIARDAMSGSPIADASIGITQRGPGTGDHFVTTVRTQATGQFSFAGAVAGTYSLLIRADGHASVQQTITIPASGVTNLVFDLASENTLRGTIRDALTGQAIPGALTLLVRNDNDLLRDTTFSDEAGGYEFDGLAAGSYTLLARADDHQTVVIANLTLGTGAGLRDVSLGAPSVTVTGAVQNVSGTPANVVVTATNDHGFVVAQTAVAADGTYSLTNLPPGVHTLVARGDGYAPSPPVTVSVSQGQMLANVNLNLTAVALAQSFEVMAPPDDDNSLVLAALSLQAAATSAAPATWLNDLGKQLIVANQAQKLVPSDSRIELLIASADEPCRTKYGDDARDAVNAVNRAYFDLKSKFTLATRTIGDFTGLVADLTRAPRTIDNLSSQFPEILTLVTKYLGTSSGDTAVNANATPTLTTGELARFTETFPGLDISKEDPGPGLSQALARLQNGINKAKARVASGDFAGAQKIIGSLNNAIGLFQSLFQRWGDQLVKFKSTSISEGDSGTDTGDLARIQTLVTSGGLGPTSLANLREAINRPELTKIMDAVEDFRQQRLAFFRAHAKALAKVLGLLKCTPPPTPKPPPAPPPSCNATTGGTGKLVQSLFANAEALSLDSGSASLNLLRPVCEDKRNVSQGPTVVTAIDPNDKIGPSGFGIQNFIQPGVMPFEIEFENSAAVGATAAAQEVVITDIIDANVDPASVRFTGFGFGSHKFTVPPGLSHYETTIDLRPDGIDLLVPVRLEFDVSTRVLKATFRSLDPVTGLPPDDPDAGFLPINNANHDGEGFFTYTLLPSSGITSGTVIFNQASIVFDTNAPILTPMTASKIDAVTPTSSLVPLTPKENNSFTVKWTGADETDGSGIATYDVYVSDNGADYTLWQSATTATSALFTGATANHSYRFYVIASDNVGHVENVPATFDAQTVISDLVWQNAEKPLDVDHDTFIVAADVVTIINYINANHSGLLPAVRPSNKSYVDVNGDKNVAADDVVTIINWINAHPGRSGEPADFSTDVVDSLATTTESRASGLPVDDTALLALLATDVASQPKRRRL
jgi:hypothetical protein